MSNQLNLFLEHGASTDARGLTSYKIAPLSDASEVWGVRTEQTLLDSQWQWPEHQGRVLARSGRFADSDQMSPWQLWSNAGHEALTEALERAGGQRSPQQQLCIVPHVEDVISDLPGALGISTSERAGVSVALAPSQMLTISMLASIDDHLLRLFEVLAERCSVVYLTDCRQVDERLIACPLGQGLLPRDMILDLIKMWIDPTLPIVILADDLSAQIEWLGQEM